MKYVPGTAKFELKELEYQKRDTYEVTICCDANDGDYMEKVVEWTEFTEQDILMFAYLNLSNHNDASKWPDTKELYKKDCNIPFGGTYVSENSRFDKEACDMDDDEDEDDYYSSGWLDDYVNNNDLLLFCGACDSSCHSICSLSVIYYDENSTAFECKMPDIQKLFESEEEFINYVLSLDEGE